MAEDGSGTWWALSFGAALPAVGLAAAGGATGLAGGTGVALAGAAAAYLALDLAVIQPILDRKLLRGSDSLASMARAFLKRALVVRTVSDVAAELESTARAALGTDRTILVVPDPSVGGIRVIGGDGDEARRVGDAEKAFLWLGDRVEPIDRAALAQLREFEGARATDELLARLGAHVVMPLRHRGLLLGVAVLGAPARAYPASQLATFYRALAAHTTVAVANTYLDLEARGKKSLSKAFDLATAMQEALLPEDRPIRRGAISLRGIYRPVAECGGDLWTYTDLGRGRVLVLVGDATGHGAAPAMLTAVAKGAIDAMRHVAGAELDPAQLLVSMNRAVYRAGRTRYLMTAFAMVVDSVAGEIRYANAAQNFPYVLSRGPDGRPRLEALVARGNTLGATPEAHYVVSTRRLAVGERVVLYTDGVIDAGAPMFEPFGEKRFRAILAAQADTPAQRLPEVLSAEVDGYLSGRPFADDITVVSVEITPIEEPGSIQTPPPSGGRA